MPELLTGSLETANAKEYCLSFEQNLLAVDICNVRTFLNRRFSKYVDLVVFKRVLCEHQGWFILQGTVLMSVLLSLILKRAGPVKQVDVTNFCAPIWTQQHVTLVQFMLMEPHNQTFSSFNFMTAINTRLIIICLYINVIV